MARQLERRSQRMEQESELEVQCCNGHWERISEVLSSAAVQVRPAFSSFSHHILSRITSSALVHAFLEAICALVKFREAACALSHAECDPLVLCTSIISRAPR